MNYKKYLRLGKDYPDDMPLYANSKVFNQFINDFCNIFKSAKVEKVAGIEAKGFIYASAIASKMRVGVILIRKQGLQRSVFKQKYIDYTHRQKQLSIIKDIVKKNERVLIVDDWVDTGETVKTAIKLIERAGGKVVGVGAFMDISTKKVREFLKKYNYHYLEKAMPEDDFLTSKVKKQAAENLI